MEEVIRVGMAEVKVAKAPGEIVTLGLGSCIGICAYDPVNRIGGMVHIMLPDSTMSPDKVNPAKFADTGIPLLIVEMEKMGASLNRIELKIVGGAQMFSTSGVQERMGIGSRNIQAVEEVCSKLVLPLVAKCVGGNTGRSVRLDLETGAVWVKTLAQGTSSL